MSTIPKKMVSKIISWYCCQCSVCPIGYSKCHFKKNGYFADITPKICSEKLFAFFKRHSRNKTPSKMFKVMASYDGINE